MSVHILGVRHHSPACAHRVAWRIRQLRPAFVLIEGPADFNHRMEELFLPHQLPIAIYSYFSADNDVHRSSWSPFAEYSPEWQALVAGKEVGAAIRFMDLPAWHDAFTHLENRYADTGDAEAEQRSETYHAVLAEKLAVDNRDALWDQLFEDNISHPPQEEELKNLDTALDAYFAHLRADDPGSLGNQAREQMMASWIAWAAAQNQGPVLVVCGGYHAPALARLWPDLSGDEPVLPLPENAVSENAVSEDEAAVEARAGLRYGSYLLPYTFKRLDAFTGYASGMPSPAFYQEVWQQGMTMAGEEMLQQITTRLRQKKIPLSTADLLGVHTRAYGLASLRGHATPLRVDWLDALAGAMVKDALTTPLPWAYRGTLLPGTEPIIVQAMDVLAGDKTGRLAPGTPQPPLIASVRAALETLEIPEHGNLSLDLYTPKGREKSRVLHQLGILQIPGLQRQSGPDNALEATGEEQWFLSLAQNLHLQQAALVEAGAWGATLKDAARACLEHQLHQAGNDIQRLADSLNQAAFAGLSQMSQSCLANLETGIAHVQKFEPLGLTLASLHSLLRHGEMVDMAESPLLVNVVEAAFDRCLWLFELPGMVTPADAHSHILAVKALVQVCADLEAEQRWNTESTWLPALSSERARAVLHRKTDHPESAALSRGAALGALLALGVPEALEQEARTYDDLLTTQALSLLTRLAPAQLGDALAGMVALAREVLPYNPVFIKGLDERVRQMDDLDFVLALPAMRGAFAWLPTQERGELARSILKLHQTQHLSQYNLLAPLKESDAESIAAARLAEQQAISDLAKWGITLEPLTESGRNHP